MPDIHVNEYWLVALAIVDLLSKGFGLWAASRNNQRNWFIAILIINSAGILPAIYLKYFQKKRK